MWKWLARLLNRHETQQQQQTFSQPSPPMPAPSLIPPIDPAAFEPMPRTPATPIQPTPATPIVAPRDAATAPWVDPTGQGQTREQWEAWQQSRRNSQAVTDNLGKLGVDIPIMDKATQDRILAAFDAELAARGEEIAWFRLGQNELGDRTQMEFALINRGMTFLEFNQTFNKWNSHGTPAALLPPGFRNPKRDPDRKR